MIKVSVRGLEEVRKKLATLGKEAKHFSESKVGEYLVGDQTHGLKHYPGYVYVNRYAGFPELAYRTSTGKIVPGFKSKEQHGYVMAMIGEGKIDPGVPHRTGELQRGWELNDRGRFWEIRNQTEYAGWVMGDVGQTRMHNLIGWRKVMDNIRDNLKGAFRHAQAELKKWLKTRR